MPVQIIWTPVEERSAEWTNKSIQMDSTVQKGYHTNSSISISLKTLNEQRDSILASSRSRQSVSSIYSKQYPIKIATFAQTTQEDVKSEFEIKETPWMSLKPDRSVEESEPSF